MNVIAICSQKGGVGKTTLSIHLSVLADRMATPALIVDTDHTQGSLSFWHDLREAETPVHVRCTPDDLPAVLRDARLDGIEWAVVDTAPHDEPGVSLAMRLADLVVIPVRPGILDLAAVAPTVNMAKALRRPFLTVINSAPPWRGVMEPSVVAEARRALEDMGAPVWRGQITQRAGLAHSLTVGMAAGEFDPHGQAATEMEALWRDVSRAAASVPAQARGGDRG